MTNPVKPPQVPYRRTDEDTPADFLAPAPAASRTEAPKPRKGGWWKTLLILLVIVAALCAAAVPLYNHFFAPAGVSGDVPEAAVMHTLPFSADDTGSMYLQEPAVPQNGCLFCNS